MPPDLNILLTGLLALATVLGLVWAGARVARLSGLAPRTGSGRSLAVRDVIAIDARRRLLIVRCGAREVVLLTGGSQDLVVGWLDAGATSAGAGPEHLVTGGPPAEKAPGA